MIHDDVTSASAGTGGDAEAPLTSFGRYVNLKFLGQGGMARVYSAFDPNLGRMVALKLIRGNDPEMRTRLQLEARAQARMEHPNVCKIFEVGEVDSEPYIAMQFIQGRTLKDAAAEMNLAEKVRLMRDVSQAMHTAHRAGLVHRDLKPANIMVEKQEDGRWIPFVMDFGLAREAQAPGMTATGIVVGTPWYMPPEQARGEIQKLDRRSDVYSLGATLYELLCGKLPFESESIVELLMHVLHDDPISLRVRDGSLPEDLETIVMKCLEKDPARRYDSARALAEDLERYLEGDPIQARPTALTYRIRKKVRKHRALFITATAALVLILVFAAFGIRARINASQQAALANQLGQEVKEIEGILRFAQLLPLHDIGPEKKLVRDRIQAIEKRRSNLSAGPADYAIGRGFLALQEYDRARTHLEAAWVAFPQPEVAFARGLVLGFLYRRELEDADQTRNRELREARRRDAERRFRDPALQYLKIGAGASGESTEYVEGLIAFFERDYERALRKSAEATKKMPWLFEARHLAGEIHLSKGKAEYLEENNYDAALQSLKLAEGEFRQEKEVARSSPRAYGGLCAVKLTQMEVEMYSSGREIESMAQEAVEQCNRALQIDPENIDAQLLLTRTAMRWGEHLSGRGEDPRGKLQQAISSAEQVIRLDPESYLAYQNTGIAWRLRANYERTHGIDAVPSLERAIAAFQKSLAIHPGYAMAYGSLGNAYILRSQIEAEKGLSPRKSLDSAIQSLRKSLELSPGLVSALNNLGVAYNYLAEYELSVGEDPFRSTTEAIRVFSKAVELKPEDPLPYGNLGNPYMFQGMFEEDSGKIPESNYQNAVRSYRKAMEINPKHSVAVANLGLVYKRLGISGWNSGKDPEKDFQQALEFSAMACELSQEPFPCAEAAETQFEYGLFLLMTSGNPDAQIREGLRWANHALSIHSESSDAHAALARIKLLEARTKIRNKDNPASSFAEAEREIQEALRITPDYVLYHTTAAVIFRVHADFAIRSGKDAEDLIQKGLVHAGKALSIIPNRSEFLALRGSLLSLKARNGDAASALLARELMEKALQQNSFLKREYGPYLDQM